MADEAGFLKLQFWDEGLTHANRAYGRLMLDHVVRAIRGPAPAEARA